MANSQIVRFPTGISNTTEASGLADLKIPNPFTYYMVADDFAAFVPADWRVAGTLPGTAVLATNTSGGILNLTTTAAVSETSLTPNIHTFLHSSSTDFFFSCRFKMNDMSGGFLVGVADSAATAPITSSPTFGWYFTKPIGAGAVGSFVYRTLGATAFSVAMPDVLFRNGLFYTVTLAYSSDEGIARGFIIGDAFQGVPTNTAARLFTGGGLGMITVVGPTFAVSSDATAKTFQIDNYLVAMER